MKRIFKYMESVLNVIMAVLFMGMTVLIAINVTSRYIFHSPITWAEELVRYMFIWSVMTGAVAAMAKNKHLNVDILSEKFSTKGKLIQDTIIRIVVCAYFICLAIGGWTVIAQVYIQLSATLRISMAIPYSAIGICAVIMAIQEIYFVVMNVRKLRGKEEVNV